MSQSRPLYLGPRLRRLRRELGLTQQAMASDLDISASYVALLERNQRPVTAQILLRLADAYDLDLRSLSADDPGGGAGLEEVLADKMFAVRAAAGDSFSFKASDVAFEVLTESGRAKPAPYLARARWVWFAEISGEDEAEVADWLASAHALVAAKLPRKTRTALGIM